MTLVTGNSSSSGSVNHTVVVSPPETADLSILRSPAGMLQVEGDASATDGYLLANLGDVASEVVLTEVGDFLAQTPTAFTLGPGETRDLARGGNGFSRYVRRHVGRDWNAFRWRDRCPVRLLVSAASTAPPDVRVDLLRVDLVDVPGVDESGSVNLTNIGTAQPTAFSSPTVSGSCRTAERSRSLRRFGRRFPS